MEKSEKFRELLEEAAAMLVQADFLIQDSDVFDEEDYECGYLPLIERIREALK